jgi:hypothetical protein
VLEIGELSLFWKKKKPASLEFYDGGNDRRQAFRMVPNADKPILITINGNVVEVVNISGAGVSIRAYNLPVGAVLSTMLHLPSENIIFPVTLEVMMKQGDLCCCRFNQIHREAEDLLHAYILDLQKEKIRRKYRH